MSLVESIVNVIAGFALAVATQMLVFPLLRLRVSVGTNMILGAVFTVVSIARSYLLRRLFERLRLHGLQREAAAQRRTAATTALWVGQLPMR